MLGNQPIVDSKVYKNSRSIKIRGLFFFFLNNVILSDTNEAIFLHRYHHLIKINHSIKKISFLNDFCHQLLSKWACEPYNVFKNRYVYHQLCHFVSLSFDFLSNRNQSSANQIKDVITYFKCLIIFNWKC